MLEEDRLAWQQLATSARLRELPEEDHPMLGEIDTTVDDWELLDKEDFLMEEAEQKQNQSTDRQIHQPNQRQADVSTKRHQLPPESVNR